MEEEYIKETDNVKEEAEKIANAYTSVKANKIDLHRCRLRVQLYKRCLDSNFQNMGLNQQKFLFVDEDVSNDIIDDRDQNVGSFDLQCMSEPNCCCEMGKSI